MDVEVSELAWLTATEVVRSVRAGDLSLQEVTRAMRARIAYLDQKIHAFVALDPSAQAAAGPLGGIALGVKDTQPVAGLPWTYGTARWRNRIAERDAIPIARLRSAGAAILGKLNLPELAAAVGTTNELVPPTENPWRTGYTPGGSSGGSGAAVAAGLCTAATGDDMGGSIRIPAACCGVFGLRPSPGAIPDEIPDATNLSVRGPLARSAADLRLLFEAMSAQPAPSIRPRRLRIGLVSSSPLGADEACLAAARRAAGVLEGLGHRVGEVAWDPVPVLHSYQVVRPVTMGIQPGEPEEYGEGVREAIRRGRATDAPEFLLALQSGLAAARRLRDLLDSDYDLLLTPTLGLQPMPIGEVPRFLEESWERYIQFLLPVTYASLPAVAVPAGRSPAGLPVSVQLVGRRSHEWRVLETAEQLEAAGFRFERPPGFE